MVVSGTEKIGSSQGITAAYPAAQDLTAANRDRWEMFQKRWPAQRNNTSAQKIPAKIKKDIADLVSQVARPR
jgi:hypothetical protein